MTVASRRTASVVVCAATVLALFAPAAQAQELRLTDSTKDVWVSSGAGFTHTYAAESKLADVRWVQIGHGATRIVLTAKLVELTKQGAEVGLFVEFRTSSGLSRDARLSGQVGDRNGSVAFTSPTGKLLACDTSHKINYVANTMMMSVPRSCLNNPSYVQFRSETSWVTDSTYDVYVDNPHNTNLAFDGWSSRVRRG